MRLNSRTPVAPLLLLLLPSIVAALAVEKSSTKLQADQSKDSTAIDSAIAVSGPPASKGAGTKDAPVDGLDGKPHAGPYVESTRKKQSQQIEDLGSSTKPASGKEKEKVLAETFDRPEDDGVMADLTSHKKVTGPTGTEGGVSQKDRERKEKGEAEKKKPEQPKEAPPRVDNGKSKSTPSSKDGDDEKEKKKGAAGLEKPADLPEKPHDIPHPNPPTLHDSDPKTKLPGSAEPIDDSLLHPFHSFFISWTMIIFSEIGDKTFLVAALMAMRHDRMVVFSAAVSALFVMTVLSAVLGHAVPTLLPKKLTGYAAALLFFVFGIKLLREGLAMDAEEGVGEEMREVEMELEEKEQEMRRSKRRSSVSPYLMESGRLGRLRSSSSTLPAPLRSPSTSPSPPPTPGASSSLSSILSGFNNLCSLLLSPAWVQTFAMTFLGEWGDRSQIATIAMAAGQDYWWITAGAVVGHAMCSAVAVIGGRALAGKVSMRIVTLGGAIAFLVFGVIYLAESLYYR
ncbi:UPF0016-domain-containing protein [Microthyrium microscopicum]|uniref:UPF0016-domain-containing protein n=1 Tax=Microthyrium microscopicum TaxID=703497 RepID=A0A6A6UMX9_9PEZI|nr:UPF0016-domain-containing protein [Microthyrium microscopicum]